MTSDGEPETNYNRNECWNVDTSQLWDYWADQASVGQVLDTTTIHGNQDITKAYRSNVIHENNDGITQTVTERGSTRSLFDPSYYVWGYVYFAY